LRPWPVRLPAFLEYGREHQARIAPAARIRPAVIREDLSMKRIPAHCLRAGTARVCLALMLGLLIVPGYVVVPILFAHAGSHALAGMLAGHIFHAANLGILALALGVAAMWLWSGHGCRMLWGLLLAVVFLVALNEFWVAGVIGDLKNAMGSVEATPPDDPLRQRFGIWHGVSSLMHLFSSLLTLGLLVCSGNHHGGSACRD